MWSIRRNVMCIGIEQYCMIVGLLKHYLKNRHVLTYTDLFCINLIIFARNKSSAVGIAIFINFVFINLSPQVNQSKSETVCQNIKVNWSDVVLDRISYLVVFILFSTKSYTIAFYLLLLWTLLPNNFKDENIFYLFDWTIIQIR